MISQIFGSANFSIFCPRLVLTLDSELPSGSQAALFHGGAEYRPFDFISLRAGLDQSRAAVGDGQYSTVNNLTGGLGVEFYGVKFDYAYYRAADYDVNSTHYFSVSFSGLPQDMITDIKPVEPTRIEESAPKGAGSKVLDVPAPAKPNSPSKEVKAKWVAVLPE